MDVDSYYLPIDFYWGWNPQDSARYERGGPPEPSALVPDVDDWPQIVEVSSGDPGGTVPYLVYLSNLLRALGDHVPNLLSKSSSNQPEIDKTIKFLEELSVHPVSGGECWREQIKYYQDQIGELKAGLTSTEVKTSNEVKISTLKLVSNRILKDVLEHWHVDSYAIADDFCWDVVGSVRYKPDAPKPCSGSLSDDWRVIEKIAQEDPAGKLPALVHLSNLLRFLGDHPYLVHAKIDTPTKKPRGIYRAYSEDVYESAKSEELETESAVAGARYANVCLTEGEARVMVPQKMQLGTSRDYQLRLDIGPLSSDSVVTNAEQNPFRADLLARSDDGHWLQVVAASDEFSIEPVPYNLFLPIIGPSWVCNCAPGGKHSCDEQARSDHLFIPTKAPDKAGTAHVRIALYFLKNLVQSQLLTAEVSEEPQLGSGYSSSIDYSLTANLQDVGFLPQRTVNILTDQVADGASKLVINCGGDTAINLPLPTEGRVRTALDLVRKALSDIHFEEYGGQLGAAVQHRNLYDSNNSKSKEEFIEDLRKLAPVGYELYDSLFWDGNKRKALEAALNQTNVQIQISRPKDTSLTFPWALMYGIPLESDPSKHKLCGVLADWNGRAFSGNPSVCPHEAEHEPNTVCPFGFWGYRYIIEHPPSFERELPDKIPSGSKEMKIVVGRIPNWSSP